MGPRSICPFGFLGVPQASEKVHETSPQGSNIESAQPARAPELYPTLSV